MKHPPTKCIAIDCDGTLVSNGVVRMGVINLAYDYKARGFDVILWSARGRAYAERVANWTGTTDIWTAIIGKPGYIVDDQGWKWIRFTKVIRQLLPSVKLSDNRVANQ